MKQQFLEIEKDHEILNKTYMRELKKGDQMHQALQKVKQIVAAMIKRVCLECAHSQELSDL